MEDFDFSLSDPEVVEIILTDSCIDTEYVNDGKHIICRAAYTFSETSIMHESLSVVVKLYSKRTLGDRCIGEVNMSLKALFDDWAKGGSATLTCPIKQGNVETSAVLNVSYCFGDTLLVKKPALWKKCLVAGATILLKLTLLATVGPTG